MSKRQGPIRWNLTDYKDTKAREGTIIVDLDDQGSQLVIPPVELWPDTFHDRMRENDDFRTDAAAQARMIVGDDAYAAFVAAGGSALLFHALLKDSQEADAGE